MVLGEGEWEDWGRAGDCGSNRLDLEQAAASWSFHSSVRRLWMGFPGLLSPCSQLVSRAAAAIFLFDLELFLECWCHLFLYCSSKTLTRLQAVIVSCRVFCCFVFVFLLGFAGIGVGCFCKGRYFPSWATAIALEVLEELDRVHLVSSLSLLGIQLSIYLLLHKILFTSFYEDDDLLSLVCKPLSRTHNCISFSQINYLMSFLCLQKPLKQSQFYQFVCEWIPC